ncbi:uncharacterized protein LOC114947031 isoform X3 [Acropora millepora]|nr:uncharacterized protein LOC114947031 isoform X3 [Acropora millepora]
MDDMGAKLIGSIRKYIGTGLEPRIVFDNLDFKILANVILQNHRNSDMHWIAHFLTFERVSSENLDDSKPQKANVEDFELVEYLLNRSELEKLCSDFIVLVARVLVEFFCFMATLGGSVIPKHISHSMIFQVLCFNEKRACDHWPTCSVPFNQSKHSDVCQYLEYVQSLLLDIYKPEGQPEPVNAGDILKKAKLPVAGDLLGRGRITGARNTGLGCDSPSERFTNIVEVPGLWHTNQSFLGFIWEQLYSQQL